MGIPCTPSSSASSLTPWSAGRSVHARRRQGCLGRYVEPDSERLLHARFQALGAAAVLKLGVLEAWRTDGAARVARRAVVFHGHAQEVGIELAVVVLVVERRQPVH